MKKTTASAAVWTVLAWVSAAAAHPAPQSPLEPTQAVSSIHQEILTRYCVGCHNQTTLTAGLAIDGLDPSQVDRDRGTWEKVVRKLRAGMMPPSGAPRPAPQAYESLIAWLEGELDRTAAARFPSPGLHRLNRTEYANAVRDLLDLSIDPRPLLPSDDSSFGFDNMAGTLGISSTLVEAYVSAAQKISRLAIGSETEPIQVTYRAPEDAAQDYHIEGLPFGTRGGMRIEHEFPADGEYRITALALRGDNMSPGPFGSVDGEQLQILVDGALAAQGEFPGRSGELGVRVPISAGLHRIGVTFLETNFAPILDIRQQFMRDTIQTGPFPGYTFFPHVGSVRIEGPFAAAGAADSPSRQKIFVCRPEGPETEPACAREILERLATRALRRPPSPEDMDDLMGFYERGRAAGGFDHGIEMALARMLASIQFVYRIEAPPDEDRGSAPGEAQPLDDLDLAARLSFFLWSSIPDDELLEAAIEGRLGDPGVLEAQVRRMLADPRAEALAVNFAGQWLNLRGLDAVGPLPMLYPDFDDPLRQSMRREVELLFDAIVREDRSVLDLLDSDYTFVDERLARHYGIPNVYGSRFRRIELGPALDVRRGLTGKGAILTTTSKPERTSPVTRGKWIMTNILGVSPPDPPANVPPLPPGEGDELTEPTVREKMRAHQSRPDCVQCHRLMDPIGFALENFDGIAMWRSEEGGRPIDASGSLYDGRPVEGPAELRAWLLGYADQFVQVAVEKLLTYALGRGLADMDMPVVRAIAREAASNDNRFSSLVLGVVRSDPFQMTMGPDTAE